MKTGRSKAKDYDMVFEGGGAKGMAFVGALQVLEQSQHSPSRLTEAFTGAIMATFLAAGYSAGEMAAALYEKENVQPVFLGFLEIPPKLSGEEIQHSGIRQALRDVNVKFIPDLIESKIDDAIAYTLAQSSFITSRLYSFVENGVFLLPRIFLTGRGSS